MMFKKKWIGNIILLILSSLIFFILLELFLWVLQVESLKEKENPFLTFSSRPLFEEKIEEGKRILKTSLEKQGFFNVQSFHLEKRKGDRRIFTLGGSTTYGRPYRDIVSFSGWLRNYLNKFSLNQNWDVINAGGISYASYRILKLAEEFLNYNPDYFIFYMGHNEFLESRTYQKVKNLPFPLQWVNQKISKTRLYALGFRFLNSKEKTNALKTSNLNQDHLVQKVQNINNNLKLNKEVDTKLDHAVGPEQFYRDDRLQRKIVEHFKFSLTKMIELANERGIHVILINPASNLKDCSPFKSQWDFSSSQDSIQILTLWKQGLKEEETGNDSLAIHLFQRLVDQKVRYSYLHYRLANLLFKNKKYVLAKEHFLKSKEEDVCPLRILEPLEKTISSFRNHPNVTFIDAKVLLEQELEKKLNHSILGEEFFFDHVHLKIEQHQFLAQALVKVIDSIERFYFKKEFSFTEALSDTTLLAEVERETLSQINNLEKGLALHQLSKVLNWAGKHEDAVRISYQAIELDSMHDEAYFSFIYIGTSLDRDGEILKAISYYQRAFEINSNSTEAMQLLAYSFFREKQFDSAQFYYEKLFLYTQNQVKTKLSYRLGLLSIMNQYWKKANKYLLSVEGEYSKKIEWLYGVGLSFLKLQEYEEARIYFEKLLIFSPNHPWANSSMGIIFEKLGDLNQAQIFYRKALYFKPNLEEAKEGLLKLK